MRLLHVLVVATALHSSLALSQIGREEMTVETMAAPGPNWFIAKTGNGGYIFDGETGEMQGLLSLSRRSPAVVPYAPRQEFYAPESYLSRAVRGTRTDVVTIYDFENLSPVAEIEIPNHMARLSVRNHLALLNNGRHLIVHNLNPGSSVSVVDVEDRVLVYEAFTPGCAVNLPVGDSGFLQLCGDGSLQLMQLDLSGFEENRVRSDVFFDVQEDAIFDRSARLNEGWLLISHAGRIYEVDADGEEIIIGEDWSIVPEDESGWRPGGFELLSVHRDLGLLYVAMHEGEEHSHHELGSEIWVISLATRQRIHRLPVEAGVYSLMVTQEEEPILVVQGEENAYQIFDALSFKHLRSIEAPGADIFEDF